LSIAERLQKALSDKGLSPAELSRRAGVPQPRLSQILSGKTPNPRWDTISKLSVHLGVPAEWLFSGKEDTFIAPQPTVQETSTDYLKQKDRRLRELVFIFERLPDDDRDSLLKAARGLALVNESRENGEGGSNSTEMNSA